MVLRKNVLETKHPNQHSKMVLNIRALAQAAVKNLEGYYSRSNLGPLLKAKLPLPYSCHPGAEFTPEFTPTKVSYYQSLIGVLRHVIELGRKELAMEVSAMASITALSREGHLKAVLHFFHSTRVSTIELHCLILLGLRLT